MDSEFTMTGFAGQGEHHIRNHLLQNPQSTEDNGGIHPTAIVHPSVRLGKNVKIGPYSIVDEGVSLGDGCELSNHVTIKGPTEIGKSNRFYSYASMGQDPQDKKYQGEGESRLVIGDNNIFREFTVVHRGTPTGNGITVVGSDLLMMNFCHVAHDCVIGNNIVMANNVNIGGHVTIEDNVILGGSTTIHQFTAVGTCTMTGGQTLIAQDVPPYVIANGNRVSLFGVNKIGLERNGFSREEIENVKKAYKIFFRSKLSQKDALERLEAELGTSPAVQHFISFVRNSTRGICR